MYINFWYPVILSEELKDEPVKVRMLGQNFVTFRDSKGAPKTLSDTCVHRGGSLSGGVVRGDCIQCPYHGWRFDGEGECIVPAPRDVVVDVDTGNKSSD